MDCDKLLTGLLELFPALLQYMAVTFSLLMPGWTPVTLRTSRIRQLSKIRLSICPPSPDSVWRNSRITYGGTNGDWNNLSGSIIVKNLFDGLQMRFWSNDATLEPWMFNGCPHGPGHHAPDDVVPSAVVWRRCTALSDLRGCLPMISSGCEEDVMVVLTGGRAAEGDNINQAGSAMNGKGSHSINIEAGRVGNNVRIAVSLTNSRPQTTTTMVKTSRILPSSKAQRDS
ncbi:hypothetical protein AC579_10296 [Pseudocercospora musae]|uniref:Uncharacterized protein n=1 Tax=Pseudocercospora musae TaxID=113226 RepID=A0A139ICG9_9PEZI|nr:hypothetical protein AC579_10296 [Pseudocercospora musae]